MKILVTGDSGFIGSNLVERIEKEFKEIHIYKFNSRSSLSELEQYTKDCDFVFHLAAIHRPKDASEFGKVNYELTSYILECLEKYNNTCPFLYTSSIQAGNGSEYGDSKINAENAVIKYAKRAGRRAIIYRLTNTFGKGARPNGHSVVATFCYNIQRNLPIQISNREYIMNFYYIDDVIDSFMECLNKENTFTGCEIKVLCDELIYKVSLGELVDLLYYFKECSALGKTPLLENDFQKKLFITFDSYKE